MGSFNQLLKSVKESKQDFEFYPTTNEIIACIQSDIRTLYDLEDDEPIKHTVLDCGAGDGRVLYQLTEGTKLAIEKSKPLLELLAKDIVIIGTEFDQQTLIDKRADIVFSNPPYSEFAKWSLKIIKEANANVIYLVIPRRWRTNKKLQDVLKQRKGEAKIIGEFDFLNADRSATCKVDVIRVALAGYYFRGKFNLSNKPCVDPFDLWFDENFPAPKDEDNVSSSLNDRVEALRNELVSGDGLIECLEQLYQKDLKNLCANYQAINSLDPKLLNELGVTLETVRLGLKTKIEGLKNLYWEELFRNLRTITNRLTHSSRNKLLKKLTEQTHVDFSKNNVYAVVIWTIKQANHYFDEQLVQLFEDMTEKANVILYQSNRNTFALENWRYGQRPEDLTFYKLDYRIVLEDMGGICSSGSFSSGTKHGLGVRATNFLNDLCTVASNLGFDTSSYPKAEEFEWSSGTKHKFCFDDLKNTTMKQQVLFDVRAYKKGTLHLRLNQSFIQRLNIEHGRLKGWLKNAKQASEDLEISLTEASECFNSNIKLNASTVPLLGYKNKGVYGTGC